MKRTPPPTDRHAPTSAHRLHGHNDAARKMRMDRPHDEYGGGLEGKLPEDPTPEEIAERSEMIRARWSDRVKKKRHLRAPVQWSVPNVHVADIELPPAGG